MRKLFILLLIPSMVMGQTCFIHEGKNKYSKLQACNDGDQLYFYVAKLVLKDEKEINRIISTTKNSFCDLSYKINIDQDESKTTLICTFKNNLNIKD